jgi:heme/copper-type cytochrome/quinol oxidase subunit 2
VRGRVVAGAWVAAIVAIGSMGAACSSNGDGGGSTAPPASGGDSATITVKDFEFVPGSLAVPSGSSAITITNTGSVEHSFTLDDGSVSQDIEAGASETVTVNLTADAPFHCKYHTQMTGTLTVG